METCRTFDEWVINYAPLLNDEENNTWWNYCSDAWHDAQRSMRDRILDGLIYEQAVESIGLYPQSVEGGKNPYEKRTEAMEAHNKCIMSVTQHANDIYDFIKASGYQREIEDAWILDIIEISAFKKKEEIRILINCNDLFYWACSDAEVIKPEEVGDVLKCLGESSKHGHLLYVCRKRKMRPQKPYYEYFSEDEKKLFDACGPVRKEAQ